MRIVSLVTRLTMVSFCFYAFDALAQGSANKSYIKVTTQPVISEEAVLAPSLEEVLGRIQLKQTASPNSPISTVSQQVDRSADILLQTKQLEFQINSNHPLELLAENAGEFAREEHSLAERVEVSITPIDRRLRLKRCDKAPTYTWTSANNTLGNTSITARCDGSAPWKVLIRARVQVFQHIPVLLVPVGKDDILTQELVTSRLLDVSALRRETLRSIDNVVGYRFKRRVPAGREINSSVLAAPIVVSKGDLVLISATNQVIDIQMKGTALSGGEVGRKIQVRSNSSGRVIQTWIKGPGQVVVSP